MKSVQTTTSVVPAERQCPRCGGKLGGFGPEGLCGACLIGSGLEEEGSVPAVVAPAGQLRRFGDYELMEEVARGGMGVVYRARQVSLDRVVALKMILSGELAGPEEVSRFRREAEAAARLKHPNIVAIHEVGECTGQHFFSMDYVEGRTLRQLTRDNPLPAPRAAALLKTIAEAVHYAHQQGLIHRDLKPSNVLIDVAGQPHVTDFGLAKRFGSAADLTVSGAAVGTPGYMPPEQAAGGSKTVGPLADVYALGAMLYDLLTGRPPHRAETPLQTMAQTVNEEPVAPRLLNPGISRDLETIALKCLEKEPVRRYASARDLALDLGRFLSHEPIAARPSSTWYRAAKWARRRPATVALVGTIVLALVAISVVSTTLGLRARTAEGLATRRLNEVTAERNQKEQARQAAEAAREEAEGVSKFLVRVFESPDPNTEGGGRTNTVAASLDAAVVKLEKDPSLRPERRAKLQAVIGSTYHELGLYPEAIALKEKVLAYYQTSLGPEHDDTLDAMNNLANSYNKVLRDEEALKLQEPLLTLCRKLLGLEHPRTLIAQNNLASSYEAVGRHGEAIKLLEEALTLSRKLHGLEDPDSLIAQNNLANSYEAVGRREEALKLQEEALSLYRKTMGPDNPGTIKAMYNLAHSYYSSGRRKEALKLSEEALTLYRKVLGTGHPDTLRAMNNLAIVYHSAGRREEALKLREEVLTIRRKLLGPEHPDTLGAMQNLANSYHDAGLREEALKLQEEALTLYRKVLGPEHPKTLDALHNLAICYHDAGRQEEALKLREEVLTLYRKVHGVEHPDTLRAMGKLVDSYQDAARREEALKLRVEVLTIHRKLLGPEHPDTLAAMHNLANSYHAAGRREEALKLREELLTLSRKVLGTEHRGTLRAMGNLAISYQDAGRQEEALKLWEEAGRLGDPHKLREELTTAKARGTNASLAELAAMVLLGEGLLRQGDCTNAEPLLRECVAMYEKEQPGLSPLFNAQGLLGWSMLCKEDYGEAERLLLLAQEGLKKRQSERPSSDRAATIRDNATRLVQLYEAWGKPDKAAEWREKAK